MAHAHALSLSLYVLYYTDTTILTNYISPRRKEFWVLLHRGLTLNRHPKPKAHEATWSRDHARGQWPLHAEHSIYG